MNILFLLLAIALFIALVLKNVPIVIATILSSIFLLLTQQMDLYDGITATYMTGFGDYVRDFFLLLCWVHSLESWWEISGAANSIFYIYLPSLWRSLCNHRLIIMGIILTLGGVNLFVAMFTMYPWPWLCSAGQTSPASSLLPLILWLCRCDDDRAHTVYPERDTTVYLGTQWPPPLFRA